MFLITILRSVQYSPTVTATVSLMHLAITFRYGYGSVHELPTPVRYGHQRPYTVTVPLVNTYSTCKILINPLLFRPLSIIVVLGPAITLKSTQFPCNSHPITSTSLSSNLC
jgi:hypothetical protein